MSEEQQIHKLFNVIFRLKSTELNQCIEIIFRQSKFYIVYSELFGQEIIKDTGVIKRFGVSATVNNFKEQWVFYFAQHHNSE